MKKVLIILLVLVVVVIGGLALAPFLIPVDTLKQQLQAQVEGATGRALRIDGPVDLQLLPTLAVEAQDVRFANAEGAANPDMATLKGLQASDIALGDIRLEDGRVTYSDARSGVSHQAENIDLSVELENLRSPLHAAGSLDYKGKQVTLDVGVQAPLALIQNGTSQAKVQV